MAKDPASGKNDAEILDYRHDRTRRKNNPPAGLAWQGRIAERPTERYAYNPHGQSEARRPALGLRREQLGPARQWLFHVRRDSQLLTVELSKLV
jgi:hypothetical protein